MRNQSTSQYRIFRPDIGEKAKASSYYGMDADMAGDHCALCGRFVDVTWQGLLREWHGIWWQVFGVHGTIR